MTVTLTADTLNPLIGSNVTLTCNAVNTSNSEINTWSLYRNGSLLSTQSTGIFQVTVNEFNNKFFCSAKSDWTLDANSTELQIQARGTHKMS